MKGKALIVIGLILVAAIVLISKLLGGAVALAGGAFNTILGIIIVIALIAIVIFMFAYAGKKRKK